MDNYTYILECRDGSYYCGWTNDLKKRVITHQHGKGGKYTRAKLPVKLIYYEVYATKEEAMKREWAIKHLTKKDKKMLLQVGLTKEQQKFIKECNEAVE